MKIAEWKEAYAEKVARRRYEPPYDFYDLADHLRAVLEDEHPA